MLSVRFRHTDYDGQIVETDLLIGTPEEWAERPERETGEWSGGIVDLASLIDLDATSLIEALLSGPAPRLFLALKLGDSDRMALPLTKL